MLKVLWYSDFLCSSGFANVATDLLHRLHATGDYAFTVLGVNPSGIPYGDRVKSCPYRVIEVSQGGDVLGSKLVAQHVHDLDYDVFFALQDPFNMVKIWSRVTKPRGKHVLYFPIDATFKAGWLPSLQMADVAVAYTHFGRQQVLAAASNAVVDVIPHGTDSAVFYRDAAAGAAFRHKIGVGPNDFLLTNVNRNQPRKDMKRSVLVWLMRLLMHIPKTGGTALAVSLRRSGFRLRHSNRRRNAGGLDYALADAREARAEFLCLHEFYPNVKSYFPKNDVIVFFRDPVQRVLSHYYHDLRSGQTAPFDAFVVNHANLQSRYAKGLDLEAAFVGVFELYTESLRRLSLHLGRDLVATPVRTNPDKPLDQLYAPTEAQRELIYKHNLLDMDLYVRAVRAFGEVKP